MLFLDENDDGELSVFAKVSIFKVVSKVDEGGDGGSGGVKGRALGIEHAEVELLYTIVTLGTTSEVFFLASVAIVWLPIADDFDELHGCSCMWFWFFWWLSVLRWSVVCFEMSALHCKNLSRWLDRWYIDGIRYMVMKYLFCEMLSK